MRLLSAALVPPISYFLIVEDESLAASPHAVKDDRLAQRFRHGDIPAEDSPNALEDEFLIGRQDFLDQAFGKHNRPFLKDKIVT